MDWDDTKHQAFDFETSGWLAEYALQPWRMLQPVPENLHLYTGEPSEDRTKAWATSLVWTTHDGEKLSAHGGLMPTKKDIAHMLEEAIKYKRRLLGWNTTFDIMVCLGYGLEDLVMEAKFLDGMLLWRHAFIEPEYEEKGPNKKSYGLKAAVAEFMPSQAGYEEDVDFHDRDPLVRKKLHAYNMRDTAFTHACAREAWGKLTQRQQRAAMIEAESLPQIALANFRGMMVDTFATRELQAKLARDADECLTLLAPLGVTEKVVRSPKQLSALLYDDWGLPVLKENKSKITGNVSRSTDKEALHELAFIDPRAKKIREYREALNNKTKFADSILNSWEYNEDECTHPSGIIFGTYCVPGETEVLTREGWRRIDQWPGGEIVQVRPDLSMCFGHADRHDAGSVDEWVEIPKLRCMFTRAHTMPYLAQKTFMWRTQPAEQWLRSGEVKYAPVAGNIVLHGKYTPDQMRLFAAVQADGSFVSKRYRDTTYPPDLKFCFKKQRKITRLCALLEKLCIRYRRYISAAHPDRTEIHIARGSLPIWLDRNKKLLGPWLLDTTHAGLSAFVDELVHWDGTAHADGGVKYCSAIDTNREWVATAAALVGRKASIHQTMTVHISDERPLCTVLPKHSNLVRARHAAFCPVTETGFWLARSNGRIFVTGNSGRMTYGSKQGKGVNQKQTGFALHQEKRGSEFRSVLRAPPGYTLVEFDAAGQEFRWMAIASRDEQMLQLCLPGEDPHSFMGAAIAERDYKNLIKSLEHAEKEIAKQAKEDRQLGKVANLCCIADSPILTNRGYAAIQDVRADDLVWDGQEFVAHDGVVCSGVRRVMTYDGLTTTPGHEVLVDGEWETLEDAARHGWRITPALGEGWAGRSWSTLRIVDGIIHRTIHEVWGAVCSSAVQLWRGARCQLAVYGDRPLDAVSHMCDTRTPHSTRTHRPHRSSGLPAGEASGSVAATLPQPQGPLVAQLRGTWDRVQVRNDTRCCDVCDDASAPRDIPRGGHRPRGQQWSLRAWKLALGLPAKQPAEQAGIEHDQLAGGDHPDQRVARKPVLADLYDALCGARAFWRRYSAPGRAGCFGEAKELENDRGEARVYDIVNCGPRNRFACNGRIVHNSLQYRTSAKKLRVVARVQYNLPMELPQAERIHKTYQRTYKGVPLYWDQQIRATKHNGYVETFAGRRVVVRGNWSGMFGWSMGSTAINYRIQGTGADQKYLAMLVLKDYVRSIGAYFAWDLHDGLYFYVPDAKVQEALVEMKKRLDNLPYKEAWGFTPPIPLPFDAKVGPSWGSLREHQFN